MENKVPRWRKGKLWQPDIIVTRQERKRSHEVESNKYVSPESVLQRICSGDVSYVEMVQLRFFDRTLVEILDQVRQRGKPVVVNITEQFPEDGMYTQERLRHMLSCLESVDCVVVPDSQTEPFSLRDQPDAFQSNCHFLTRDLSAKSADLVHRARSLFRDPAKDVHLSHVKLLEAADLEEAVNYYQNLGLQVVVVTGVLDLLHPGHIDFLEEASNQGQILIILTNSDHSASIQDKNIVGKGDRPIYPLRDRLPTLAALEFVDHVVPFDTKAALPILERLRGIIYVKTKKDLASMTVKKEMQAVESGGGRVIVLPTIENPFTKQTMSSTLMLNRARTLAREEVLRVADVSLYPQEVKGIFEEVIEAIRAWDNASPHLSGWSRDLRRRYRTSLKDAKNIERWVLEEICSCSNTIISTLSSRRKYHSFVIPYLIGKMIDFDIRMIPIIYKEKAEQVVVNAALLSDGTVGFFDSNRPAAYEPFVFEEAFWRAFEYQSNFIPWEGVDTFAARIYIHPSRRHRVGIAAQILLNAKENFTEEHLKRTLADFIRSIWSTYMGSDPTQSPQGGETDSKNEVLTSYKFRMPGIVGHGGEAVLNTAGGFPENSRSGLRDALAKGIDIIELDVVSCQDGWIVSHDAKLSVATEILDNNKSTFDFTEEELRRIRIRLNDGTISDETLMTVPEALGLIAQQRKGQKDQLAVKIDIKYSIPESEALLIEELKASGLSLDQILMTSGIPQVSERIHAIEPDLQFEFNPVEPLLFLYGFNIQDKNVIPTVLLEFFNKFAPRINARTISIPQFAMNRWADKVYERLVKGIHKMGLETQVWVVANVEEYLKACMLGVTYVLMHKPELISTVLEIKDRSSAVSDELERLSNTALNELYGSVSGDELNLDPANFIQYISRQYKAEMSDGLREFLTFLQSVLGSSSV